MITFKIHEISKVPSNVVYNSGKWQMVIYPISSRFAYNGDKPVWYLMNKSLILMLVQVIKLFFGNVAVLR